MADVTLRVHRKQAERFEDEEGRRSFHTQRARLIHGLVDTLDLEVKDWGETDATYPHEWVDIIVALGSAGVFMAMVNAFKVWTERDKIDNVEIITPDGPTLRIRNATSRDIRAVLQRLGLQAPRKARKRKA